MSKRESKRKVRHALENAELNGLSFWGVMTDKTKETEPPESVSTDMVDLKAIAVSFGELVHRTDSNIEVVVEIVKAAYDRSVKLSIDGISNKPGRLPNGRKPGTKS